MHYMTISLSLVEQNPDLYARWQQQRIALAMLHQLARRLRETHLQILAELQEHQPQAGFSELSSVAMETATRQLQEELATQADAVENRDREFTAASSVA